jgi:hypothetical protein
MFLRELLMAIRALHFSQRVMEFLAVARQAGFDLCAQPGELAGFSQVGIEQLHRLREHTRELTGSTQTPLLDCRKGPPVIVPPQPEPQSTKG